ncbi:MAG: DNA topoisomerase (ATP-hydrolyzing) subunit B [Absicoccus sp.]|uniref:DNA gyrase subunit B n=1 Tax=Absicoccus intestinalis TaxID=2926319 RepID=A0ABU4WP28_9FIRM|nr:MULTISPECIES: DNA topoisomerase (ATP-hydrolyzing) subunit B [unclassified Absicoccus]MDX8418013.1 DNA topoisomerase (ATP-hydrolyzing) subunit B [Absicoccus sp. CLA-KB-P134]MDY3036096.1 DNA topoisomerase (ATP-hydrolyzing) subunit B [Absicoccus sp.]
MSQEELKQEILEFDQLENEATSVDHSYTADDIQVLEGLEAVRLRPGMYIGSTSARGLHHLVWEIVDNGIDEALAGFANKIDVTIEPDDVIAVRDNGRGMPVGIHEKTGVSAVETILTVLHAGGKFGGGAYKVSGGLHGVGASVVNALSSWMEVTVYQNGKIYFIRFENGGHTVAPLKEIGTTQETGTLVRFKADPTIFKETTSYDFDTLNSRLRQLAFLNKGIRLTLTDLREEEPIKENYYYEGGIIEYVRFINRNKTPITDDVIYCEGLVDGILAEVALQYNEGYQSNIYSFCNNIHTHEGGYHEDGFRMALTREINKYALDHNILKKDEKLSQDDVKEGLVCIISVKHPNPQYEGQTKTKLGNSEVRKIVSSIVGKQLQRYFLENPDQAKKIVDKATLASKARMAAKKARELTRRKSALDGISSLPGKLTDCSSKDASECEIYIVEGNSAGGSAKQGRDAKTQAILPLRGKIINVEKAREHRIFDNAEIRSMITAFGCGIKDEVDLAKLRYHKIIIMTDADVDGAHIATLMLTFLYRYMRPVIEGGYVYIAQPPLYKVQKGKKIVYAYKEQEMNQIRSELKDGYKVQRYKGLGEMDAEQLWETTMDPKHRILKRVTIDDAEYADNTFELLMGEEVDPRREFIQENAVYANLDY